MIMFQSLSYFQRFDVNGALSCGAGWYASRLGLVSGILEMLPQFFYCFCLWIEDGEIRSLCGPDLLIQDCLFKLKSHWIITIFTKVWKSQINCALKQNTEIIVFGVCVFVKHLIYIYIYIYSMFLILLFLRFFLIKRPQCFLFFTLD